MHKITLFSCLAAITILTAGLDNAGTKASYLKTDQGEYYRYQIVKLSLKPDSLLRINPDSASLQVSFRHGDSLISGVGSCSGINLKYDKTDSAWHGTWAMPWNPPLGVYQAVLNTYSDKAIKDSTTLLLSDSVTFIVRSRTPHSIPDGFCAMTIESAGNMLNAKLPSPVKTKKHWTNFTDWAKYLGADAVWYSVGWTIEGYPGLNDKNPWVKENFKVFPKLAEECHKQGLKFGGYVGSYLLWGPTLRKLKYDYSLEAKNGRVFPNHHVNLDDVKRRADIVKILKLLQEDPNVDFIGLDYIRPGAGGFETVDEFVEQMNIEKPPGWNKWSKKDRILWVARQVKPMSDKPIRARWQWWQAHRSATAVERLIAEAGVSKPVWGFTLGWDKGHEHGQDPPMMNDAGLDLDAMMIYESNAQQCLEMTNVWSKYLKGNEVQMMAGQQIDWVLLQKSVIPPAPEEFYWRLTDAIKGTSDGGRLKGLFWHDMFRGIRGRKGPHTSQEWLIVGAAAFSKLRQELGTLPLEARMISEAGKTGLHIKLKRPLEKIIIEPLTNASPGKIRVVELADSTTDTAIILGRSPANGLAAYRLTWGSDDHRDQVVVFSYYPHPYAENPFRPLQSFRAGGDLLIAVQPGRNNSAKAISAGKLARQNGLVPNRTALDSLVPSLGYKYSKLLIIAGDSLSASEITAVNNFTSALPDFPIALLTNKDSMPGLPDVKMIRLKSDISSDPEYLRFVKSFSTTTKRNYSSGLKLSLHLDK
ncbi:MAG: hypothetical protein KKG02_05430 [Candidatus Edwardsbacteria bacterium]|nr:hypothetical protein [Candidatus Edwardsbacteria bacterium]